MVTRYVAHRQSLRRRSSAESAERAHPGASEGGSRMVFPPGGARAQDPSVRRLTRSLVRAPAAAREAPAAVNLPAMASHLRPSVAAASRSRHSLVVWVIG